MRTPSNEGGARIADSRYAKRFRDLALTQSPNALFISCSDSRALPDLLASPILASSSSCATSGKLVPPATAEGLSIGDLSEVSAIEYGCSC